MPRLTTPLILFAALTLAPTCAETEAPAPFECRYDAPFFDGEPDATLRIGSVDPASGAFTDWTEDTTVEVVRGLQGGYMILPQIALEGATDDTCVQLTVDNLPDPDNPTSGDTFQLFPGLTVVQQLSVDPVTGLLTSSGLQDQIGWDPPSALPMRLQITARGRDFAARGHVDLIAGEAIPEACLRLSSDGTPCDHLEIPGQIQIDAIEDPQPGIHEVCRNDGVVVRYTFTPDDPEATACYNASDFSGLLTLGSLGPPRSCLDDAGLTVGATFSTTRLLPRVDYCTPQDVFDVDLDACAAQCDAP